MHNNIPILVRNINANNDFSKVDGEGIAVRASFINADLCKSHQSLPSGLYVNTVDATGSDGVCLDLNGVNSGGMLVAVRDDGQGGGIATIESDSLQLRNYTSQPYLSYKTNTLTLGQTGDDVFLSASPSAGSAGTEVASCRFVQDVVANVYTNNGVFSADNSFTGSNTFTNTNNTFAFSPHSSQLPVDGFDLANKAYVDATVGNRSGNGVIFYFNKSQPINGYGTLSTSVDVSPTSNVSLTNFNTTASQLVYGFITAPSYPEITTLPLGIWNCLIWGKATNDVGTLNYRADLYKYSSSGVETLLFTGGLSTDINAIANPNIYACQITVNTPITLVTTDRLLVKVYAVASGVANTTVLTTYFEGNYYSYTTSSVGIGTNLLNANNNWTGTNAFFDPVSLGAGVKDTSASLGTSGQIMTSTGAGLSWLPSSALSDWLGATLASSTYQTIANMANYLTTASAGSIYQTISAMSNYLTTASASATYQTISAMSNYLTVASAVSTYQTIANMTNYLTTASASATYQTISSMSNYLTVASASSTYQTISAMSNYLTTVNAGSTYLSKAGGTMTGDINMGLHSISGVVNINGSAYPPTATNPTLASVLTNGNSASTSVNMNTNPIVGCTSLTTGNITTTTFTDISGVTGSANQVLTSGTSGGNNKWLSANALPDWLGLTLANATYQTISSMTNYLTTATASSTYQTIANMANYLTTASASSTYQTIANMANYLTNATANTTYQTISGMSSYATLSGATFTGSLVASSLSVPAAGNGTVTAANFDSGAGTVIRIGSTATNRTANILIGNQTGNTGTIILGTTGGTTPVSIQGQVTLVKPLLLGSVPTGDTQLGFTAFSLASINSGVFSAGTVYFYAGLSQSNILAGSVTPSAGQAVSYTAGIYMCNVNARIYSQGNPTAGTIGAIGIGYQVGSGSTPVATPNTNIISGTQTSTFPNIGMTGASNFCLYLNASFPISIVTGNTFFNVYFRTAITTALTGGTLTMEITSMGMTRIG